MDIKRNLIAVGIDIGATKIVIAASKNGKKPTIIQDGSSRNTVTCVAFKKLGRFLGFEAEIKATAYPENVIFGKDIKSILGRDELSHNSNLMRNTVKVVKSNNYLQFDVSYKDKNILIFPEQVIALLLNHLRKNLEKHFENSSIGKCVISMCCASSNRQRSAMIDACILAGFNLDTLVVINGTTAAAVDYWIDRYMNPIKNILIFDMGSTHSEVALMSMNENEIELKTCEGTLELGGDTFVQRLVEHFVSNFDDTLMINDKNSLVRIGNACEKLKIALSTSKEAVVTIEKFCDAQPYVLRCNRPEFNNMCRDLLQIITQTIENVVCRNVVDVVIVIGGAARIPTIEELLTSIVHCPVSKVLNQDESMAIGAALYASKLIENYPLDLKLKHLELVSPAIDVSFNVQQFDSPKIDRLKQQIDEIECDEQRFQDKMHAINEIEFECLQYKRLLQNDHLHDKVKNAIINECNSILDYLSNHDLPLNDAFQSRRNELKVNFQQRFESSQKCHNSDEAHKLMTTGSFDNAFKLYDRLVEDYPREPIFLLERARCLCQQGKFKASIADCDRILQDNCDDTDLVSSTRTLRETAEKKMVDAWVLLTKELRKDDSIDTIDQQFEHIMAHDALKNPKYDKQKSQLYYNHAIFCFKNKKCNKAIDICTKGLGLGWKENVYSFLKIRAQSYFNVRYFRPAIADWKTMQEMKPNTKIAEYINEAENILSKNEVDELLKECDNFKRQQRYEEALSKLNNFTNVNLKKETMIEIMYLRAQIFYEQKSFNHSIEGCTKILEMDPTNELASNLKKRAESSLQKARGKPGWYNRYNPLNWFRR